MPLKYSTPDFVALWDRHRSVAGVANEAGMSLSAVAGRRRRLMLQGHNLTSLPAPGYETRTPERYRDDGWTYERQIPLAMHSGSVVVFSDAHYWPGEPSVAHKALLSVIRKLKPRAVIANGDVFDGGSISRHPPFGWSKRPTPVDELHACQERLGEVEQAVPRGCELLWNIGNHDIRWERTLATNAEQFAGIVGMRLADHFPAWDMRWSTLVNPDAAHPVMVKHRFQSAGIHAGYQATLRAGLSTVSGHTHYLEVKGWGDYRGRRYGVQTGSLQDMDHPAFEYTEGNPSATCSGFAVLTFRDGAMLPPELCEVHGDVALFRGEAL